MSKSHSIAYPNRPFMIDVLLVVFNGASTDDLRPVVRVTESLEPRRDDTFVDGPCYKVKSSVN